MSAEAAPASQQQESHWQASRDCRARQRPVSEGARREGVPPSALRPFGQERSSFGFWVLPTTLSCFLPHEVVIRTEIRLHAKSAHLLKLSAGRLHDVLHAH